MNKLGKFAAACVAVVFAVGACGSLSGETCTYDGGWDVTPSGAGNLNLTTNATVADIVMTGSKPKLYLNGHKLRVKAEQHALGAATDPDWTKNAQIIPGEDADGNPGRIVWGSIGMMIFVR